MRALLRTAQDKGWLPRRVQDPWPGDPRVNIQNDHGKAKPYQVHHILTAIDKKDAAQ